MIILDKRVFCVSVSEKVSRTFDPFREVYIKPERMHWSKGRVMTVPAGLFHLSLRDGWATGDQSASLRHAVVRFNLSIHILTAPEEASAVDHNHNQNRRLHTLWMLHFYTVDWLTVAIEFPTYV